MNIDSDPLTLAAATPIGNQDSDLAKIHQQVQNLTKQYAKLLNALSDIHQAYEAQAQRMQQQEFCLATMPTQADIEARVAQNRQYFKVTSVKPPTFDGNIRSKAAHEAQAIIDEYLHNSETQAQLHGFLANNARPTHRAQPTYTTWVSTGLQGLALASWRRIKPEDRTQMTWTSYKTWIQSTFSSQLSLTQAISAMSTITQRSSAAVYSQSFNEMVHAISAFGTTYTAAHLCVIYRQGLKPILRSDATLFAIKDDLDHLQREAERLDDFHWRQGKTDNRVHTSTANNRFRKQQHQNNNQATHSQQQRHQIQTRNQHPFHEPPYQPQQGPYFRDETAMDLSAIHQQQQQQHNKLRSLTEQEREEYRAKNWCTFCRAHDHVISNCLKRQRFNQQKNDNNGNSNRRSHLNNIDTLQGSGYRQNSQDHQSKATETQQ